jgi:hypothetical protein
MSMTLDQVRETINSIEPRPDQLATLGPEALPHLEMLLHDEDPFLASRAIYAISQIRDNRVVELLEKAAQSDRPEVKIALAAGTKHLSQTEAHIILLALLNDQDAGVRKTALKAVSGDVPAVLRTKIQELATQDAVPFIRDLSKDIGRRLSNLSP